MKKWSIVGLLILISIFLIGCSSVIATVTTTAPVVTTIPNTTTVTVSGNTYIFQNYDDLVTQIYEDMYDDIYADIYADLSLMLTQSLYDEIYASVSASIGQLLSEEEISVYVDNFQQTIYDVVELSNHSVVGVSTYLGTEGKSLGSAVIYRFNEITNTYYLITNQHVVEGGDNYRVVFSDGNYVVATLLGVDVDVDIAILSFSGEGLSQVISVSALGDSDLMERGSIVIAVGNPRGYDFYGSVTMGVLAGVNRIVDEDSTVRYLQHDASINSGNSGGPLYNLAGEVIGINVSKYASTDIEGMGFAIPINLVKAIIAIIEALN